MSQTMMSIPIDEQDKIDFEALCGQRGMSASSAVGAFVRTALRERRLPFAESEDPFYSEANMARLRRAVADLNAGKGVEHEVIEVDDD